MWGTSVPFGAARRNRPTQCASADGTARPRHRLPVLRHDHTRVAPQAIASRSRAHGSASGQPHPGAHQVGRNSRVVEGSHHKSCNCVGIRPLHGLILLGRGAGIKAVRNTCRWAAISMVGTSAHEHRRGPQCVSERMWKHHAAVAEVGRTCLYRPEL